MTSKIAFLLFSFLFLSTSILHSQNDQALIKEGAPNVFIDCGYCDLNYVKEQIPVVNYVRDSKDADIHVLLHLRVSSGNLYITLYRTR